MGGFMTEISKRTVLYVYCCKFSGVPAVKIGWSSDPIKRCLKLGFFDKMSWFKVSADKSKIMCYEAMLHNAFSEYRFFGELPTSLHDGRTEYFEEHCFNRFKDVCEILKLDFHVYKN